MGHKSKIIGFGLLFIVVIFELFILFSGKHYLNKAIWYNFSKIDDYKIFDNHQVKSGKDNEEWAVRGDIYSFSEEFSTMHQGLGTVAFLVIKEKQIVYEQYLENYNKVSVSGSFSVAKSYVGALVGVALKEGKIKRLSQKVGDFLPSFNTGRKSKITIQNLLTMSSGLDWHESYSNPFANTTEIYYDADIQTVIDKLKVIEPAGERFKYLSGDTQILALVLQKIYGKSLSHLLSEKLWKPMGCTQDALWSTDKKGVEKAFCCLTASARDYARLGQLYLQKGGWNGNQLIDSNYIMASTSPYNYPKDEVNYYGYQWWLLPDIKEENIFYMRGLHGQYVICIPNSNTIIVRLGHKRDKKDDGIHPNEVYLMVKEVLSNQNTK